MVPSQTSMGNPGWNDAIGALRSREGGNWSPFFKPPVGEAYARIESPRGEIGYYIVSDGGPAPFRFHIRSPSFINLTPLKLMSVGMTVADAIVILGSVDIVVGEVDR